MKAVCHIKSEQDINAMNINIKEYKDQHFPAISQLFYDTVHFVNIRDYTVEQCDAWTDKSNNLITRRDALLAQKTLVAEIDGEIAGFGSIDGTGYLDMLYIHKDFGRRGVATALCEDLEKGFDVVTAHVSITAKGFFHKRGYFVLNSQCVEINGLTLKNYVMVKNIVGVE